MAWWEWLLLGVAAYLVIMFGIAVALVVTRRRADRRIREYDEFRRGSGSATL